MADNEKPAKGDAKEPKGGKEAPKGETKKQDFGPDFRYMVGSEITIMLREDLNRLKKIRSWRGHRHERKLPTRGQRTKNNGRFGGAVGVQRKVEGAQPVPEGGAAPAAPKAAGGGGAKP